MTLDNTFIFQHNKAKLQLSIKPEYLNHQFVSGNKLRKLKYNLLEAKKHNKKKVLTFGGAFSNHIAATAYAAKANNFNSIGVIRGEELATLPLNPTLSFAKECGMKFEYISRATYRIKHQNEFIEKLKHKFGDIYIIPEGGTNALAIQGCEEILQPDDSVFDVICCSVGTGGTISGLINSAKDHQKIIGFPALKGDFLSREIRKFAKAKNWELITDYHFGGYAKINDNLVEFINTFKSDYGIPLDPIYTGKMMFGIIDLMNKNYFPEGTKILAIHTGGLQGIEGVNLKLKQQNKRLID